MPHMLVVEHVSKRFGELVAVDDVSISVDKGEIVETNTPQEFFDNPQNERSRKFLSQILDR